MALRGLYMNKICFKCNEEKILSDFYKHSLMKDGHLNKCIECAKNDATKHRNKNLKSIREYDRKRGSRQDYTYTKEYRKEFPDKYKAHTIVNNAIRGNKLFKEPCEVCHTNDVIHAHHDDYGKPLNVRWLCSSHHSQWHAKNGEGLNAKQCLVVKAEALNEN